MDKKPTIEELKRLADKLSKAVMATADPDRKQPARDLVALADMADLVRTLSRKAEEMGEPEAAFLLRLASVELSGSEKSQRYEDVSRSLEGHFENAGERVAL